MTFLNQLKAQANALQTQQTQTQSSLEETTKQAEEGCRFALHYLQDLARQLSVIEPKAPRFTLDGKTPWPAMKFVEFRVDSRKKTLRDREVFSYIAMGWRIVPQLGKPVGGQVTVNFPPDLQRVESRLASGMVEHERKEIRHPEKNTLQAIRFDYITETRGNLLVTPDHDKGDMAFRLLNANGFDVINTTWPAGKVRTDLLDELAKLLVGEASRFA
ncbi:MAG: hypothetical protein H7255_20095 [Ramlibacter sp.]|nr:hypothetical protein [Ramlibacter sp.]